MTNLKKPEEYATKCSVFREAKIAPMNLNLYRDGHVKSQRDIVKAIQSAQHDAYNQAIDNAIENVSNNRFMDSEVMPLFEKLIAESILKLKI